MSPQLPFIIYGVVKYWGTPQANVDVTIKNVTKNEEATIKTNSVGEYAIDLGDVTKYPSGYSNGDLIRVSSLETYRYTTVDTSLPGIRVDIEYNPRLSGMFLEWNGLIKTVPCFSLHYFSVRKVSQYLTLFYIILGLLINKLFSTYISFKKILSFLGTKYLLKIFVLSKLVIKHLLQVFAKTFIIIKYLALKTVKQLASTYFKLFIKLQQFLSSFFKDLSFSKRSIAFLSTISIILTSRFKLTYGVLQKLFDMLSASFGILSRKVVSFMLMSKNYSVRISRLVSLYLLRSFTSIYFKISTSLRSLIKNIEILQHALLAFLKTSISSLHSLGGKVISSIFFTFRSLQKLLNICNLNFKVLILKARLLVIQYLIYQTIKRMLLMVYKTVKILKNIIVTIYKTFYLSLRSIALLHLVPKVLISSFRTLQNVYTKIHSVLDITFRTLIMKLKTASLLFKNISISSFKFIILYPSRSFSKAYLYIAMNLRSLKRSIVSLRHTIFGAISKIISAIFRITSSTKNLLGIIYQIALLGIVEQSIKIIYSLGSLLSITLRASYSSLKKLFSISRFSFNVLVLRVKTITFNWINKFKLLILFVWKYFNRRTVQSVFNLFYNALMKIAKYLQTVYSGIQTILQHFVTLFNLGGRVTKTLTSLSSSLKVVSKSLTGISSVLKKIWYQITSIASIKTILVVSNVLRTSYNVFVKYLEELGITLIRTLPIFIVTRTKLVFRTVREKIFSVLKSLVRRRTT